MRRQPCRAEPARCAFERVGEDARRAHRVIEQAAHGPTQADEAIATVEIRRDDEICVLERGERLTIALSDNAELSLPRNRTNGSPAAAASFTAAAMRRAVVATLSDDAERWRRSYTSRCEGRQRIGRHGAQTRRDTCYRPTRHQCSGRTQLPRRGKRRYESRLDATGLRS